MLAIKRNHPERVFVPIVPMHVSRQPAADSEELLRRMSAKNPALQSLIAKFDLVPGT